MASLWMTAPHSASPVSLLAASMTAASTVESAFHASPTAALLSFIADLPRYPRHLYSHHRPSRSGYDSSPSHTPHLQHTAATLLLSATHSHTIRSESTSGGTATSASDQQSRSGRNSRRDSQFSSQERALQDKQPATVLSERGQTDSGSALLTHRPLLGRLEQVDCHTSRRPHRATLTDCQKRQAALTPFDFLVTQQTQRREAAAHRREQIKWREQQAQPEVDSGQQWQQRTRQQGARGVVSHAIAPHERSSDSTEKRKSREQLGRQAAKQFALRRAERHQTKRGAVRQRDELPVDSSQQPQADSELIVVEAQQSEQDEDTQQTARTGTVSSEFITLGGEELREAVTATKRAEAPTSMLLSLHRRAVPLLPASPPLSSRPPPLSLAFLLSCMPPSCEAMEWAALCLSHLPLRADPLARMANFLSQAHSVLHITHRTPHTPPHQHTQHDADKQWQQAGCTSAQAGTLTMGWLSGFVALPSCVFLPLPDLLLPPRQLQPISLSMAASGDDNKDGAFESSVSSVHSALLRQWARLCEWRWSRRRSPSVDQLLHLLQIVSHKVEVDAARHVGRATVSFADDRSDRGRPAQHLVESLQSSLADSRLGQEAVLSSSQSWSAPGKMFDVFAVGFSCLFTLSSFPAYRSPAAVCSSIERVFHSVLPVSVEESAQQLRTSQHTAARIADTERAAAIVRARMLEAAEATQRAMQRLEERRQREAAILALHPRAGEWSVAAVSGVCIRSLPPHPLPPLSLAVAE